MGKCYPFLGEFYLSRPFGLRPSSEGYKDNIHKGIDMQPLLKGEDDDLIVSITEGVVERAKLGRKSDGDAGYGNYVWVKNNDGTGAIYCHMSKLLCKVGQKVSCKTPLGVVGNSGNSSVTHLHLGISKYQDYVQTHYVGTDAWTDPALYFGITYNSKDGWKKIDGSILVLDSDREKQESKEEVIVEKVNSNSRIASSITASGEYYKVENLSGATGDWLFGRRYRVIIVGKDGNSLDVSDLRVTFEIKKSTANEINTSIVKIYNLSPETENKIIRNGKQIVIEAGYSGSQYGKIFSGGILQPVRSKENGTDYVLTLVSIDCDRYVQYGLVSVSMVAEQNQRDAVEACISKAGVTTKQNYNIEKGIVANTNITYPRGKVLFGTPSVLLDQIARTNNASYYTDDGEVNIVGAKDLADGEIFDLSPDSGLIETPSQNEYGITGKCLLNPRIKLNSLIHVNNKIVKEQEYSPGSIVRSLDTNGIYRIIRLTYSGDTRGEEWETKFDAISQAGTIPGLLVGDAVYTG